MNDVKLKFIKTKNGLYIVNINHNDRVKELSNEQLTRINILNILEKYKYSNILIYSNEMSIITDLQTIISNSSLSISYVLDSNISYTNFQTYLNGFILAITGIYPMQNRYDGIKHVIGSGSSLSPNLEQYRNINSSYIMINANKKDNKLGGYLDFLLVNYSNNKGAVSSFSNGETKLLEYASFSNRKKFNSNADVLKIATLNTKQDLFEFIVMIKNMENKGCIDIRDLQYSIKDECMWFNDVYCTQRNNLRAFVEVDSLFDSQICDTDINIRKFIDYRKRIKPFTRCKQCFRDIELNKLHIRYLSENPNIQYYLKLRRVLKSFSVANNLKSGNIYFPTQNKYLIHRENQKSYYQDEFFLFKYELDYYLYDDNLFKFYKINYSLAEQIEKIIFNGKEKFSVGELLKEKNGK